MKTTFLIHQILNPMKNIIVLLLLPLACFAQSGSSLYHVVKVNGDILNMNQGKSLSTGDKIMSSDNLRFQTINASALAINEKSEKYNLKRPAIDISTNDDMGFTVMLAATPVLSRNQLTTRGLVNTERAIVDLKSYFGKDDFAVIGDSMSVLLDESLFPLNNNKFVVFHYIINGKTVSKKLGFNNQYLIIEKDKLLEVEGKQILGNQITGIEVYQHEVSSDNSEKITEINLVFVDKESLFKEFDAMIQVLNKLYSTNEEKIEYLTNYFGDVYGLTDLRLLMKVMDEYVLTLN